MSKVYRDKHKILEVLYNFDKTAEPVDPFEPQYYNFGPETTEIAKQLDWKDGHYLNSLLASLRDSGHVTMHEITFDVRYEYSITNSGKDIYLHRFLLNKVWFRKKTFWAWLITTMLSIISLVVAISK